MQKIKLGDILKIEKGKKPKNESPIAQEGFLPYVDIKAFEKGIIASYADGVKCLPCEEGDLLIVCDGARSGLLGKAKKGYVGSTLAKISADGLKNEYLAYFIQGKYCELNTKMKGTGTPHLNQVLLKSYELNIPPLAEQEKIVLKIEELFSELDKGITELEQARTRLKIYRQSVLKNAFEGVTGEITLNEVCEHITDGDHQAPPKAETGIPFIMITNFEKNTINFSNTKFVPETYYNQIGSKRTPQKGDVLFSAVGSYGIPMLIDFDKKFCFQRHIALLRPKTVTAEYLYYTLLTSDVYIQATEYSTGTAQKTVPLSGLRKIIIPICDYTKQKEITAELDSRLSICDNIEQTISDSLKKAESLRQSILKKAFNGELV